MALQVTNTLTGKKEPFVPLQDRQVRMYVCGLTPYEEAHIGHARAYVAYDVLRRYLEHRGFSIKHIQNITDVDDRILNKAKDTGERPLAYAQRIHDLSVEMFDRLNIQRPQAYPKVSEHIQGIIEMTQTLIEKGHAYEGQDEFGTSVYFSVASDPDYGKLSHLNRDQMLEGVRKDVAGGKRDAADFALWKAAKPGEGVAWDSPWGQGRPGWHIECSVMAKAMLGETIDVHGGGWDLIFPHHENELAQSESANGVPFVKYWLHVGFLTVEGVKMSKSLGNFTTVRQALEKWRPEALRLWLAGTHYRSPVDYSEAGLMQATKNVERIENMLANARHALQGATPGPAAATDAEVLATVEARKAAFAEAMDNDFNTPVALAVLFDLLSDINKYAAGKPHRDTLKAAETAFLELAGIFAVVPAAPTNGHTDQTGVADQLLDLLLEAREAARKRKDFTAADRIRDRLAELEFVIEDTATGPRWRKKSA